MVHYLVEKDKTFENEESLLDYIFEDVRYDLAKERMDEVREEVREEFEFSSELL